MVDPYALHRSALVFDGHADTAQRFADESWDFLSPAGHGMLSLASARAGHLAAQCFALWTDPGEYGPQASLARTLTLADAVLEQVRRHPRELALCLTPADIQAAHAEGRFGVVLTIEGGQAIENSLAHLRTFHRLGVRAMTLTWSHTTDWADSSGDRPRHGGLTAFGREVVLEMNRLGMLVDVSHAADTTFADVLATSHAPVYASHSAARALTASPRNLTDDQMRALADCGGLAMVNFFPAFISEPWRTAWEASRAERHAALDEVCRPYREQGQPVPFHITNAVDRRFAERIGPPPVSALLDHLDHMLDIMGEDHVGLGSDFDGIPSAPQGLETAAGLSAITAGLLERGHSEAAVRKVLGENLLRVWDEAIAAAG